MAKAEKKRIGTMNCLGCGKEAPVNEVVGSKKLVVPCAWCDFTLYATPGTGVYATALAKVKRDAAPAEPPKPPEEKKVEEKKTTRRTWP